MHAWQSLFGGLRLAAVGLHLAMAAIEVLVLFPLLSEGIRRDRKQRWSRRLLQILGIRLHVSGRVPTGGLLVANHISFLDIFVINAIAPAAFVAKADVARWPLIGWLCGKTGNLFVRRGSARSAHRTACGMEVLLRAGQLLAVFPEGTTTAGADALPFHPGLLQSAVAAAAPVRCVALRYTDGGGRRRMEPAYVGDISLLSCLHRICGAVDLHARVDVLPALAGDDRRELALRARQAIRQALQQPVVPTVNTEWLGNGIATWPQAICNEEAIRS